MTQPRGPRDAGRVPRYAGPATSARLTVDVDVLDPASAQGTGTPEAGGPTSRELLQVLRSSAELRLVGADVVEVAPAYDHAQITGVAAAHVAYELVSAMAPRPGSQPGDRSRSAEELARA